MDLETVLELVRDVHGDDATLSLGCGGGRVWIAASGDLVAVARGDVVHVRPALGERLDDDTDADEIAVARGELEALARALEDWARRREELAAFVEERTRNPAGARHYFQPAGPDEDRHRVGPRSRRGPWRGHDEVRSIEPIDIAPGARLVAERWRVGECVEPPDVLVGLRYRIGSELRVDARREQAVVRRLGRGGGALVLDHRGHAFLTAIASSYGRRE